ncbi:MAG: iron ABC transporter permease, partial [Acidimicrobiia bacterium]|nr:iron ABC transporter permease [Acidimicrobiia bacterium]
MTLPPAPRLRPRVVVIALVVLGAAVAAGLLIGPASVPTGGVLAEIADRLPFVSLDSGLDDRQAA